MEEKNSEKKERKMRDSGIPWIGEVPEGWGIHPLYSYFAERKNKNSMLQEQNLLSLSYGKIIRKDINTNGGLLPANFTTYNIVQPNDIVIRPTDLQNDKKSLRTGLVTEKGIITSAYISLQPIANIYIKYFHYLLHSYDINKVFYNMGNGVRQGLNYSEFSKLMLLCPGKEEQHRIADFLDSKCSEIDTLIENLRARVESAKEYKKAVITEAVTKGLDKDAKMKDSGVEWIGEVPEGWKICKVKQISNKITDGAHISPDTTNGEFKFLSVTNMNDTGALDFVNCLKINSVQYAYLVKTGCQPKKDDVLISKDGTIGKTTVVSDNNFVVASSLVIIRPNQLKIRPKYLKYCLMSNIVQEQLLSVLAGSALKRVSIEKNANLKFVYTYDMTTQQQIIDYLDSKCSEIDTLLQNYEDQIATLEEYKKSLIYEYVTGKKEVPEA